MMTVGSLFSGIGGLEHGLERTGGFRTIWQSENDAYASAVLRKHYPNVPNLGDITKINWEQVQRPDLICGGFPCQDISVAGKGAGIKEGTRSGLWSHFAKAIGVLRPRYALIENVPMLAKRGLNIVLSDIAQEGYDAEWFTIRASDVGAPHRRERIFIIAYSNGIGHIHRKPTVQPAETEQQAQCEPEPSVPTANSDSQRWESGSNGTELRIEQEQQLGESGKEGGRVHSTTSKQIITSYLRSERIQRNSEIKIRRFPDFQRFADCRRTEDFANRPDIPQPLVRGGDDGVPNRIHRIKCIGNSVVPQVAQVVGEMILEMEEAK